ncbi:methyltransferase-domain-containing protein [Xylogone sp. PMI_703]|nr:methyltransferase-domain-containing protein [Xylogone sp. PMI_703]
MFAVPGWSVDSSQLKPQNEDLQKSGPAQPASDHIGSSKSNKKRKRSNGSSKTSRVTGENLADLWETVIEGKPKLQGGDGDAKKGSKRQKAEAADRETGSKRREEEVSAVSRESIPPKEKTKKKKKQPHGESDAALTSGPSSTSATQLSKPTTSLTPLQAAMRQKLVSARFRHLNQVLYTTPSAKSLEIFEKNPEMFEEYHEGFRRQVEVWPENPVDGFVLEVRQRGKVQGPIAKKRKESGENKSQDAEISPLPRSAGFCHIADLGCGDAKLAQQLQKDVKKLHLNIRSYDLHNPSPLIIRADIANLPLESGSIDVAIFCLALMGTNWIDFVEEAFRVLRWKGELWVAEIKSRFGRVDGKNGRVEHSVGNRKRVNKKEKEEDDDHDEDVVAEIDGQANGKQETDVSAFVEVLKKRGFVLQNDKAVDLSNKMFVKMHFIKGLTPVKGKYVPLPKAGEQTGSETWKKKPKMKFLDTQEDASSANEVNVLKPCVYKLR